MADLCSDFSTSAVCLRIAFFIGPIVMCKPALAVAASAAQWRAGLVRILQRLVGLQTRGRPMGGYNLPEQLAQSHRERLPVRVACRARTARARSAEAPPEHAQHEHQHECERRVLAQQGLCVEVARLVRVRVRTMVRVSAAGRVC
eukprot:scaffold91069_cov56-Phaeocystis_antarctica.AAC.4